MKIFKVYDVKTPNRGTSKSAGLDFYVPKFTDGFKKDFDEKNLTKGCKIVRDHIVVFPHERVHIPSGIKATVPAGYMLCAFNKSGVSSKKGLDVMACVIDEDYQGEIGLSFVNTTDSNVYIKEEEKIIQFILVPIIYDSIEVVDKLEECFPKETERGSGGFGSTGN